MPYYTEQYTSFFISGINLKKSYQLSALLYLLFFSFEIIWDHLTLRVVYDLQKLPKLGHLVEHLFGPPPLQKEAPLSTEPPTLHSLPQKKSIIKSHLTWVYLCLRVEKTHLIYELNIMVSLGLCGCLWSEIKR